MKQLLVNKQFIAQSFNRACSTYDQVAFLQREVGQRLLNRLDFISINPRIILDLGTGTGSYLNQLQQRYKKARIIAVDIAEDMLKTIKRQKKWFDRKRYICTDVEYLPFANQSVDLIFSNLMLHWTHNLDQAIREIKRVLKPNGLLLFSTLGPDTLRELRDSWATIDTHVHVHSFIEMHQLGDMLLKSGLTDPVTDMEFITMQYSNVKTLLYDLKLTGVHNLSMQRQSSLTGKQKFQQFLSAYEQFRDLEGNIPATYEVVYGHAWSQSFSTNEKQEISIPINQIRRK